AWTSVLIPRIMPRPDLMPMTGGYRRTPTMQIGADIYCDTQIILRELERRFPQPALCTEGNAGLPWALAMWTDRPFFQNTVNLVFGSLADQIPKEFREDREQLRGAKFDVDAMKAAIPQMRDQLRAHADWIEAQLGDGRPWLLGKQPGLADVNAYMNIWYVRGNLPDAANLFARFPKMLTWEQRVKAIGHGNRERELGAAEALEIARNATPQTPMAKDEGDPNGRQPGDHVQVVPDDYGKNAVQGIIVSLSAQHIAIRRQDERAGEVVVHFPRAGFLVAPAR
ncbi:MAG: glutathione S-transferase family protein, partial [Burkholderiales bacterium]